MHSWHRNAVFAVVGGLLIQLSMVASFIFAQVAPEPHDVPVALVGPPAAAQPVRAAVDGALPGALELKPFASVQAARQAIAEREVYGALVLGPQRADLLVASAASPPVADLLRASLGAVAQGSGTQLTVRDVVPVDPDDPRSLLINLLMLPFVVTGVLTPLFMRFLAPGARGSRLLAPLALFAVAGAVVSVVLAGPVAGALPGPFLGHVAIVSLLLFAIAASTAALMAARGVAGAGLGFLVFLVIGNIASGAPTAPELLPGFWRVIGEWMPPGAAATALRDVAYFPDAALLVPLAVLLVWAAVGSAVELALGRRQRGRPLFTSLPGVATNGHRPEAARARVMAPAGPE